MGIKINLSSIKPDVWRCKQKYKTISFLKITFHLKNSSPRNMLMMLTFDEVVIHILSALRICTFKSDVFISHVMNNLPKDHLFAVIHHSERSKEIQDKVLQN